MPNARTEFWEQALARLQQTPPDFAAVDALLREHDGGWSLITSDRPPGVLHGVEHPIGGPPAEADAGARGFLISWETSDWTGIHGHPPLMYMAVIAGALEIDTFTRPDPEGPAVHHKTQTILAGQAVHATADNDRCDNFIHRIRSRENTWSLHIYGDDPGLGTRFDEAGHPTP